MPGKTAEHGLGSTPAFQPGSIAPARQRQLADRASAGQALMRDVQIRRIDRAQRFAESAAQLASVDHAGRAAEDAVLFDAVRSGEARTREHEFPVDADALGLVGITDAQRTA